MPSETLKKNISNKFDLTLGVTSSPVSKKKRRIKITGFHQDIIIHLLLLLGVKLICTVFIFLSLSSTRCAPCLFSAWNICCHPLTPAECVLTYMFSLNKASSLRRHTTTSTSPVAVGWHFNWQSFTLSGGVGRVGGSM